VREPPPAAADRAEPLTADEFAALLGRLGPFERPPRLAVAVSGGPDSMALVRLARDWAGARGGTVLALIVDHRLRAGSTAESASVAAWLQQRGIVGRNLAWLGDKPSSGVLAAARIARYGLLEAACRSEKILHLLLGHHYEDQAETVALRVAGGSGDAGLAGMAAVREVHELRLLRPLLAVPKARLVATLGRAGWPWLVDPSNTEQRFARSRLRQDAHFAGEAHWRRAHDRAVSRSAGDRWLADWLARNARPHAMGFVRLDRQAWRSLAPDPRALVLERVLRAVAGLPYPTRGATLRRLVDDDGWRRRTAGGCSLVVAGGALLVVREPGRIRERLLLGPGETRLWDGRFLIRHAQGGIAVDVAALGAGGVHALPGTLKRTLREAGVPAAVLVGVPAAMAAGELVACPTLDLYGFTPRSGFSITVTLRPAQPVAGPPFAGVNVVSKL
jgi:tRNA(Ile)-lysidine synthase